MSDEKERDEQNILEKLNSQFSEFVGSVFGESGQNFIDETSEKIKEFSNTSIKKFMEFSDDLLEKLKLNENEQVIKARDSVEDLLKQTGLLIEDDEEEF